MKPSLAVRPVRASWKPRDEQTFDPCTISTRHAMGLHFYLKILDDVGGGLIMLGVQYVETQGGALPAGLDASMALPFGDTR